jgi:diaminopimelate epimerase
MLHFYKYQGTGNDFVMIDNREGLFDRADCKLVNRLCDRRFGIGADGLILLQYHEDNLLEMVYYNSDGKEGSMCGNGGRCFVKFAHDLNLFENELKFIASDGLHEAYINQGIVKLKMIDVQSIASFPAGTFFMNTGSPHLVRFVENLQNFPVYNEGRQIRYSQEFEPKGTNVNFAQIIGSEIHVRTYERGVEDETYSCGTGVTAVAIASQEKGFKSPVKIKTKGGDLEVNFSKENDIYTNVYLVGKATKVFEGTIEA